MRQRLVLSLSIFLAMFSPLAIAQTSPFGDYSTGQQGQQQGQQTPSVDCTDPLMANSAECQAQNQTGTSAQQYPQQGVTPQINPAAVPQPGMVPPTTFNDLTHQNRNQLSRYQNALNQLPLAPQPLTEFQKFVAGTTGEVLPIFGTTLFQNAPSTFAPLLFDSLRSAGPCSHWPVR